MSRPISYGILNTFCCSVTVFDGVDALLLCMSRYVTVIMARIMGTSSFILEQSL